MSNVLGCAIGDSLGVFAETMLINNPILLAWDDKTFLGSKYHQLNPGQFSDDTQMPVMIAESLI
jgi:ADP-ribosylglycohydrolase